MNPLELYYEWNVKTRCPYCGKEKDIEHVELSINQEVLCSCNKFYPITGNIVKANPLEDENKRIDAYLKNEKKMTEYEMKKGIIIPDGVHVGQITHEETREIDYAGKKIKYQDFHITVDQMKDDGGEPITLKVSYPAILTENSMLNVALKALGYEIKIGEKIDLKKLIGLKVGYQTMTKKTPKGDFAEILKQTLKKID